MVEINKRFKALDGLRGICVLLIACVYHYGIIFESKYRLELGQYLTELMFMVSGYLAFHSYYHKISDGEVSIESFAKKRMMILANLGQRSCNSRTTFPKYTDSVLVLSGQETLSQRDKLTS